MIYKKRLMVSHENINRCFQCDKFISTGRHEGSNDLGLGLESVVAGFLLLWEAIDREQKVEWIERAGHFRGGTEKYLELWSR